MAFHRVTRTNQMTTQFNNTGVKAETGFAQAINDDAELQQASGGYIPGMGMYGALLGIRRFQRLTGN